MRWPRTPPPPLKSGDRRARRKFAWRKTRVEDEWVWLELYEIHEKYFEPAGGGPGWWHEVGRNTLDFIY
jgi:hypothetical protein